MAHASRTVRRSYSRISKKSLPNGLDCGIGLISILFYNVNYALGSGYIFDV